MLYVGKGDCGPFESPLCRFNLGLLQSIQYRYSTDWQLQIGGPGTGEGATYSPHFKSNDFLNISRVIYDTYSTVRHILYLNSY